MRVFLSDDADADLLNIHTYIAERNPAAAVSLARKFEQKFVSLSRFPFIGRDAQAFRRVFAALWWETTLSFTE
jgi:plasmid stabilization system protein ParE